MRHNSLEKEWNVSSARRLRLVIKFEKIRHWTIRHTFKALRGNLHSLPAFFGRQNPMRKVGMSKVGGTLASHIGTKSWLLAYFVGLD
jgi:hypothetical protein